MNRIIVLEFIHAFEAMLTGQRVIVVAGCLTIGC
jgi:hypothetical protein